VLALALPSVWPSALRNDVGTPVAIISQLNTQPARASVNASPPALRLDTHDSRSGWFATPFLCDSFIHYSTPVYPGALRKLLKGLRYVPNVIITDKLRSYSAAKAEALPSVEHCQGKWRNNRAENSHQPTRLRERVMKRFKSPGHAQRFLSPFGIINSHFRVGRHLYRASGYREVRKLRFTLWEEATGTRYQFNKSDR
jgi:hypothetical protein